MKLLTNNREFVSLETNDAVLTRDIPDLAAVDLDPSGRGLDAGLEFVSLPQLLDANSNIQHPGDLCVPTALLEDGNSGDGH